MNKHVELVFAQNWVDQAIEMHWEHREDEYTVSYMDSWRNNICGYDVWDNRNFTMSGDYNCMCR